MKLNPWRDDSDLQLLENVLGKWVAIGAITLGGILGWLKCPVFPPFGSLVGAVIGICVGLIAMMLFFGLVVTPLLMFVYSFVEVFRGIAILFSRGK